MRKTHYDCKHVDYEVLIGGFKIPVKLKFMHKEYDDHPQNVVASGNGGFGRCLNIKIQ